MDSDHACHKSSDHGHHPDLISDHDDEHHKTPGIQVFQVNDGLFSASLLNGTFDPVMKPQREQIQCSLLTFQI